MCSVDYQATPITFLKMFNRTRWYKRNWYISTPSALHPLREHPAVLGVEVGGVVADRGVARWRGVVQVRAVRTHSRRWLPKIRPKASSSTGQHGRSGSRTPGERTHLQETQSLIRLCANNKEQDTRDNRGYSFMLGLWWGGDGLGNDVLPES